LKKVTKTDEFRDRVQGEWLMSMCDQNLTSLKSDYDATGSICAYWDKMSDVSNDVGGKKYESLSHVAKAALTLSHGNAIPERGFSVNNSLLGKESLSLGERTIVAQRIVKDTVRLYGSVANVPIQKDLLLVCRKAHSEYALHLEQQRQLEVQEKKKKREEEMATEEKKEIKKKTEDVLNKICEQEKLQGELLKEQQIANELINEASRKLSTAIEDNNMNSAKVAQVMLSAGNAKMQETSKKMESARLSIENHRKKLDTYRSKMTASQEEPPAKKKK
jgi:hypothetical protein